jgi:cysteine desulfurase
MLLSEINSKLTKETSILSFMLVNNETGVIQPYKDIISIAKKINPEICIHSDCVQAYGKINLTPKQMGFDLLTLSSHKIHGPKGIGAIYKKKDIKLSQLIYGGGQESGLRSGTENVSGICGFGLASELIHNNLDQRIDSIRKIKAFFISELESQILGVKINSNINCSVPNIISISFNGVKSEVLLHYLESKEIFVSTGSACSSRKTIHSHVLKAMNIPPNEIEGTIRISFGHYNTIDEVSTFISVLKEVLNIMNKIKL